MNPEENRKGPGLVIRPGALGDILLALPAVELLLGCLQYPRIGWLGYPANLTWLEGTPFFSRAESIDSGRFRHVFDDRPDRLLEHFFRSFQFCIAWVKDKEGHLRGRLEKIFQDKLLWAPPFPDPGSRVHAADHLWDSMHQWPYLQPFLPLNLPAHAPAATHSTSRSTLRNPRQVVIHPGSGGSQKCWPLVHFQETAGFLASTGWKITWLLGPAEEKIESEVKAFRAAHDMAVLVGQSLQETADLLLRTRWYLGNDSGITHLAAFCGAETFALFGPTSPEVWGPKGDRVHFLYNESHPEEWLSSRQAVKIISSFFKDYEQK